MARRKRNPVEEPAVEEVEELVEEVEELEELVEECEESVEEKPAGEAIEEVPKSGTKPKMSLLASLEAEWKKRGSKIPPVERLAELKDNLRTAMKARDEAENQLKAAQKVLEESTKQMVEECGRRPIRLGTEIYDPHSRGERIFYRSRAATPDILEL